MTHAPPPSTGTPPPGPAGPGAEASSSFPATAGIFWRLPLLIAAVAGAIAYVLTDARTLNYESRAALLAPEESSVTPEEFVAEIDSDAVYVATIRTLQLDDTAATLRERIAVSNTGVVIDIVARAPSASDARALARTFAGEARDPRVIEDGALLTVHLQAITPDEALNDHTARNTAVAAAAGLVIGVLIALLIAGRGRAAGHRLDVAALTGWPVLASIPHNALTRRSLAPYDSLQQVIEAQRTAHGFRTLLVLGVEDGDGATTVAANLALASARAGMETTLVDADLADPAVHRALGIDNRYGLTDSLEPSPAPAAGWFCSGESPTFAALAVRSLAPRRWTTGIPQGETRLRVLTGGPQPDSPRAALEGSRLGEILLELANETNLTIVNGPPLEPDGSARSLLRRCEAALIVVNALTGDPQRVEAAAGGLGPNANRVIGAVVTRTLEADAVAPAGPRRVEPAGASAVSEAAGTPFASPAPERTESGGRLTRPPMGWPSRDVPGSSRPREVPPRSPDR